MGYSGSVRCTCYESGKAPLPAELRDLVFINEDGMFCLPPESSQELWHALWLWQQSGCEHGDMELVWKPLANMGGMAYFRRLVGELGLPVLARELPEYNDGAVSPQDAQSMLIELDRLTALDVIATTYSLEDSDTGSRIWEYNPGLNGVVVVGTHLMGVDPSGFFIRDHAGRVLFQSKRFTQQPASTPGPAAFRFVDSESETEFFSDTALINDPDREILRFQLQAQSVYARDWAFLIEPLRVLCETSIATGNPIRWG